MQAEEGVELPAALSQALGGELDGTKGADDDIGGGFPAAAPHLQQPAGRQEFRPRGRSQGLGQSQVCCSLLCNPGQVTWPLWGGCLICTVEMTPVLGVGLSGRLAEVKGGKTSWEGT